MKIPLFMNTKLAFSSFMSILMFILGKLEIKYNITHTHKEWSINVFKNEKKPKTKKPTLQSQLFAPTFQSTSIIIKDQSEFETH